MLGNKHNCKFCQTKFYSSANDSKVICPICGHSIIEGIKQQLLKKVSHKKQNNENILLTFDYENDQIEEFENLFQIEKEIELD